MHALMFLSYESFLTISMSETRRGSKENNSYDPPPRRPDGPSAIVPRPTRRPDGFRQLWRFGPESDSTKPGSGLSSFSSLLAQICPNVFTFVPLVCFTLTSSRSAYTKCSHWKLYGYFYFIFFRATHLLHIYCTSYDPRLGRDTKHRRSPGQ